MSKSMYLQQATIRINNYNVSRDVNCKVPETEKSKLCLLCVKQKAQRTLYVLMSRYIF